MKWAILLILVLLKPLPIAASEVIRLASGEWYPYQSQSLREGGYVAHIVKDAFAISGINVELVYLPWARGFNEVRAGRLDGSFVYSHTQERQKHVLFSDEILSVEIAVFHRTGEKIVWDELADLGKYRIGGVLGYDYGVKDLEESGVLTIQRIDNQLGNYQKLLSGRIDLLFEYPKVGVQFIAKADAEQIIEMNPKLLNMMSYSLIISKKHPRASELIKAFNKGLAEIRTRGVYQHHEQASESGAYEK